MSGTTWFGLSAHDNRSSYFDPADGAPACPVCHLADQPDWVNPAYTGPARPLDLGYTYDDVPIASQRFVEACRSIDGFRFLELPSAPGWSLVVVDRVVATQEHPSTTYEAPCPRCGRATQIAGPFPQLLGEPPHGVSRTEWVYGSASDHWDRIILQGPRYIIDEHSWKRIEEAGVTGLSTPPNPVAITPSA